MKERSLFANSAWGMISHGVRGLVGLSFVPFVIAQLGLTGYGLYSVLMLLTFYQGLVAQIDFGYPGYLINRIAQSADSIRSPEVIRRLRSFLTALLVLNALLGLVLVVGIRGVLAAFKVPSDQSYEFTRSLGLIFAANFFSILAAVLSIVWTAGHRLAHLRKIETISYFVFVGSTVALLWRTPSLSSVMIGFAFSQVLFAILLYMKTNRTFDLVLLPGVFRLQEWRDDWHEWKPFFFMRLSGVAQRQSDATLVSFLLGPQFVATYDISMKVPSLIKSFLGRVTEALIPFAGSRRLEIDRPMMRRLLELLITVEIGLGIHVAVTAGFFGHDICELWLGAGHGSIGYSLFLASFINVVTPPASILPAVLLAQGRRHSQISAWTIGISIFNVIGTIPITYHYGVNGTILFTCFQFLLLALVSLNWARAEFGIQIRSSLLTLTKVLLISFTGSLAARRFLPLESPLQFLIQFLVLQTVIGLSLLFVCSAELRELRRLMRQRALQPANSSTAV